MALLGLYLLWRLMEELTRLEAGFLLNRHSWKRLAMRFFIYACACHFPAYPTCAVWSSSALLALHSSVLLRRCDEGWVDPVSESFLSSDATPVQWC